MPRAPIRLTCALATALLAAACTTTTTVREPRPADRPALEGRDWHLVGEPGQPPGHALPASGPGAVVLRFEGGRFSVSGPCNRHSGAWAWQGGQLRLGGEGGAIASTRRMCPPALMAREQALLAALRQPLAVDAGGAYLQLTAPDGAPWRFDARDLPPAEGRELIVMVAGQRAPCTGVASGLCLQVRTAPGAPWRLHPGEIEGFTFQPGIEAVLRVREMAVPNPAADASSLRWELVEVLERGRP